MPMDRSRRAQPAEVTIAAVLLVLPVQTDTTGATKGKGGEMRFGYMTAVLLALTPATAWARPSTADAQLQAIYNTEWAWRQTEFARISDGLRSASDDHFPAVARGLGTPARLLDHRSEPHRAYSCGATFV